MSPRATRQSAEICHHFSVNSGSSVVPHKILFALVAVLFLLTPLISSAQQGGGRLCPVFTRSLGLGASGSDVANLQGFLAQEGFFRGNVTAYFGPITQAALQSWQAQNGIVSGGSPQTTGWGVLGPKTREFFRVRCGGGGGTPPQQVFFSASPSAGTAPLSVTFSVRGTGPFTINFGEGQ